MQASQKRRRHTVYNAEELCTMPDDGNRWLVKNMIPRVGRTMVWGEGGAYKTSILFDLAVAVASKEGALLRQFPIEEHGPVFLVSAEGSKYTNRDRIMNHVRARSAASPELHARGGRPLIPSNEELQLHYCQQAYVLDDPEDQKEFREDVERIKPKLLILDPLDSFLEGDENSAKETKHFRRVLDELIDEYEMSVMIIHHATKSQDNPTLRGSSAWRGWIDTSLFFRRRVVEIARGQPAVKYVEVEARKQREGEDGHIFSVLPEHDKVRRMTTYTIVDNVVDPDIYTRSIAQQHVLSALQQHGPMVQNDLATFTGYSYKRITNALRELQLDSLIDHKGQVQRSTSPDGSRQRNVQAWQALVKTSLADAAVALLKGRQEAEDAAMDQYVIGDFGPPPPITSAGAQPHGHDIGISSGVCSAAVPTGPGVQTLH